MLVAQAYCPKDYEQAKRSAQWLTELGGAKGHSLLLVEDDRITSADSIAPIYRESFDTVEVLRFKDHYDAWPTSPNDAFQTAARHIGEKYSQPFLWYEPDCSVLVAGAFDALWNEYQQAGRLFMGMFVKGLQDSPDHISGVSIYPGDLVQHAGMALIANDVPFDIAGAQQILPLAHLTKLIAHFWKGLSFSSIAELRELIGPEPVIFHSDKTGRTIELLRAEKNLSGGHQPHKNEVLRPVDHAGATVDGPPSQNTTLVREGGFPVGPEPTSTGGLLGGGRHSISDVTAGETAAPITPWADKKESIAYIDWLASEAKRFCTAPRSTVNVRERFKLAGVIKKLR